MNRDLIIDAFIRRIHLLKILLEKKGKYKSNISKNNEKTKQFSQFNTFSFVHGIDGCTNERTFDNL